MNKIEFADINKFLTSLGIIFIGAGVLFPWFINQNSEIITLSQDEIAAVSMASRKIIENQQQYLLFITEHIFFIAPFFVITGMALMFVGIIRWRKRQGVIDSIQDEELKSKRQLNIGIEEKKESIGNELESQVENREAVIQKYIDVENHIGLKLAEFYKVNYVTSQNIRIGDYQYDVILKSKIIEKREDLLIEIKLLNAAPDKARLIEIINLFVLGANYYELTQKRRATPILILILETGLDYPEPEAITRAMNSYINEIKPNLRLKIFKESEIQILEAPSFIQG